MTGYQDNSGKKEADARFSLFHPLFIMKIFVTLIIKAKVKKKRAKRTRADRIAKHK
jgi:hypothetical protein